MTPYTVSMVVAHLGNSGYATIRPLSELSLPRLGRLVQLSCTACAGHQMDSQIGNTFNCILICNLMPKKLQTPISHRSSIFV
jgi:hypothetical protein